MNLVQYIISHSRDSKVYLLGNLISAIIVLADSFIKPFIIKMLVDTVSGAASYNLWRLCSFYAVSQLMLVCISWPLEDYCTTRYMNFTTVTLLKNIKDRIYYYPYTFFQNNMVGNLIAKINDIALLAPGLIITILEDFIPLILLMLFSVILLLKVHYIFSLITLTWFIVFCLFTIISTKHALKYTKDAAEKKSHLIGFFADFISNILNVKVFSQSAAELGKFNVFKFTYLQSVFRQSAYLSKFYVTQGIFSSLCTISQIMGLIYATEHKLGITPGDFAFVIMINFKANSLLYKLSHTFRKFISQWGAVSQGLVLFHNTKPIMDKPGALPIVVSEANIVFDKVKFSYAENDKIIFQDKSINIKSKQKVGLVGYSGSGKSTFINLILRLWELSGGAITIDGQDISQITQDSLRENIGLIPQEPTLFHKSLMDNIRYGKSSATDEEVIEAAKKAGAHEFISVLPLQYDSLVGERGVKLSAGQRQRVAIARAILKNAPILILDEATSNLDSLTESLIQQSLLNFMQTKTTLIIAHRLSTLLYMDRILVFNEGKIVEDGSHKELLALNGLYKALWDEQIGGFLPENQQQNI